MKYKHLGTTWFFSFLKFCLDYENLLIHFYNFYYFQLSYNVLFVFLVHIHEFLCKLWLFHSVSWVCFYTWKWSTELLESNQCYLHDQDMPGQLLLNAQVHKAKLTNRDL